MVMIKKLILTNKSLNSIEIIVEPYLEYIDLNPNEEAIIKINGKNSKLDIEYHSDAIVLYDEHQNNIEIYLGNKLMYQS